MDSTARSANVQELLISRVERVQERAARPAVLSSGASGNDSSFFKTEITVLAGSRRADDHVIDQLQLKDFASARRVEDIIGKGSAGGKGCSSLIPEPPRSHSYLPGFRGTPAAEGDHRASTQ